MERGWTDVAGEKKVRKRNGEEIAYVSGETGRETGVGKRILFPSGMCVCTCTRTTAWQREDRESTLTRRSSYTPTDSDDLI